MKTKIFILAALIGLTIQTSAQTIPNMGFENWTFSLVCGCEIPDNWVTSNAQLGCSEVNKDSNSYQGNFAAQILTLGCAGWAQIQFPITTLPLNLNCYVRSSLTGTDTVLIRIELLKNGNVADNGLWTNTTNIDSFALITIPITQNASVIDSAIIYLRSGNNSGTELIVDSMYFDFTSGIEKNVNNSSWTLYSNPFNKYAILEFENLKNENHNLVIYNETGQLVLSVDNITTGQVKIEKKDLVNGLYFFQLRKNGQGVAAGKLIIE